MAQDPDPIVGYLISADESSWQWGGDLGSIRPSAMIFPNAEQRKFTAGASAFGTYADYYRTRGMEGLGSSFSRRAGLSAFMSGFNRVEWSAQSATESSVSRYGLTGGVPQEIATANESEWMSSLSGAVRVSPLAFGAALRGGPDRKPEPEVGASLSLARSGDLQFFWRRSYVHADMQALWRSQSATLNLAGIHDGVEGWLRFRQIHPLRIEIRASRHLWQRQDEGSLTPSIEPWGSDWSYHGFVANDGQRWTLLAGMRGMDAKLQAYGMKGELPFAKITAANLNTRSFFASAQYHSTGQSVAWITELERLDWAAYGRGHVEFWPFVSGWMDLLGLRRYFIAQASGYLWRLHIAALKPISTHWSGGASLNLMDSHQFADLRQWRPEYLVFGVADEHDYSLRLVHVLATMASLSASYHWDSWTVTYAIHQIVPVKGWYRNPQSSQPSGTSGPASKPSPKYGGAFHQFRLSWNV